MKTRNLLFLAALLSCMALHAGASVLSDAAASITTPRKWTMMPLNATLGALDLHYSLLFWNDSGLWDPVKKKIRWVGGPGSCCANPADFKMITYDEATDTWGLHDTPFTGSGHAYDANAFNPVAGLHYFEQLGSSTVHAWNDATWTTLPSAPFSATTPSLTWFPDINNGNGGLVYLGNNGNLAWYNGSSWATLSSVSLSGYNGFSEYNPVYKAVWLGGCGSRSTWLLDSNLTTRKLADAPISMGNGSTYHTCDPVGGNFLVYQRDPGVWYELDMQSNSWSQITDMTPQFTLSNAFHVPIPEYGVILVFNHASSAKYAYLYKHTLSSNVQEKPAVKAGISLEVTPNPLRASARISLFGRTDKGVSLAVYDLSGRQVADLTPALQKGAATWETGKLPSGVYVVRARTGSRVLYRHATLLK